MKNIKFFNDSIRRGFLNFRAGERKLGERLKTISSLEELQESPATYVIFGVPEDVGVRANHGKPGANSAWNSFLSSFLNIQANQYNNPDNCLILGHLDCSSMMTEANRLIREATKVGDKLGILVQLIDDMVFKLVRKIIESGKIPIIIGGGHNNAYGNIKGTSLALQKPINVLNIDAHTDLRRTDYRHSGNGFSYAKSQGYLNKYSMFGIHKNYTPQYIFDQYEADEDIRFCIWEDLIVKDSPKNEEFKKQAEFLKNEFGLEIDCDAIQFFPSSAITSSGFTVDEIRNFIKLSASNKVHYLHICEAIAQGNPVVGKTISYFVSDFIRENTIASLKNL